MSVALLIEYRCNSRPAQYVPIATQSAFAELWRPLLLALKARAGKSAAPAVELLLDAETGGPVRLAEVPALIDVFGQLAHMLETGGYERTVRDGLLRRLTHVSMVLRELDVDQPASIWLG